MPPKTRKSATTASSSKIATLPMDEKIGAHKSQAGLAISDDISDTISEKRKLVADEDEENIEVSDIFDEDNDNSDTTADAKDLLTTDGQRQLYAVGSGGYNALKTFNGQVYSGMRIGGSHTWNYDPGVWKETKVEPDRWDIDYTTTKRRARKAPKGSGVPVGTQYHWLIVGHQGTAIGRVQFVEKLDENSYHTHLVGTKYKLAHKGSSATSWSVGTVKAQREREITLLDDAKRRVQGLPPVLATEKAKVSIGKQEKGQQTLDMLLAKGKGDKNIGESREAKKRKGNNGRAKRIRDGLPMEPGV